MSKPTIMQPHEIAEAFQSAEDTFDIEAAVSQARLAGYEVPKDLPTAGMSHRLVGVGQPGIDVIIAPSGETVDQAIVLP